MKNFPHITSIVLLSIASIAYAQDDHGHSDVEFSYENNMIHVEPSAEGLIFEGEFGTGLFSNVATEPGFASEPEEGQGIGADDLIGFNVLGPLTYWDGTSFQSPGETTLTIAGVGAASDVVVSATSEIQLADFMAPANLIGQADAMGEFHSDLSFTISAGAPIGGYGLMLSLSTDGEGIADSDPFGVFLNFGELDEDLCLVTNIHVGHRGA